ncbi:MAG: tetratricopeptide repeat protein [Microcoleus vaginatus WJT46-NPBG5]|jgi:tetratricopeptide (TPR) repeat protein|nr:tetratricopeptide repeat protein [Microcoleus vaginatus WJT46-NPBG5]
MLGQTIGGRYSLISELGEGAFGKTYLAEDRHLPGNPVCAVKQLKPASTDPRTLEEARRLFHTEAEILQQLGPHEQIPRLLAHFEENREFYLVQEFIKGHDLSYELTAGKQLSESYTLALLQNTLKVLEFVHQQQVIHRDIKPSNLMRREADGKLILIDFGAVKQIRTKVVNSQGMTRSTVQIGTFGYMPSEQAQGRPKLSSDIYALGMIAIQALTGIFPDELQDDPETGEICWRNLVPVRENLADILDKMVRYDFRQRYPSATEALQALAGLETSPISIVPNKAKAWLKHSKVLYQAKRYEEAIAACEQAISIKSDFYEAWDTLGNALYELGRHHEALTSYDKAIQIKPNFPEVWNNRSRALFSLQRYEEAIFASDKAIQLKPDYYQAWNNRGFALFSLQRYEEAIAAYEQVISIKPDFEAAWFNRGSAFEELQRYEEAIACYDKAIQLKPDYPQAWNSRGLAFDNLQRYSEAIACYDKAIQLKPDYYQAWNNRGVALDNLQRYPEAIASFNQAIQLKPDFQLALDNRNEVHSKLEWYI